MDDIFESLKTMKFDFDKNQSGVIHRFYIKNHTEETKKMISDSKKGKKQTPEHIEKSRIGHLGFKQTDYQKQKAKECLSSNWLITDPTGKTFTIFNLREFCKKNKLDQGNMVKVSQGIIKQNKGWKCLKISS